MITTKRITTDDPLYPQQVQLRHDVLFAPLDFSIERFRDEYPGVEDTLVHFVAVFDHPTGPMVLGTASMLPNSPDQHTGKVMQMAVHPQRRGEGLGAHLLADLERYAFGSLGLSALYCHAQITACDFYTKCGWSIDDSIPQFIEAGITHRVMRCQAPSGADNPQPPQTFDWDD